MTAAIIAGAVGAAASRRRARACVGCAHRLDGHRNERGRCTVTGCECARFVWEPHTQTGWCRVCRQAVWQDDQHFALVAGSVAETCRALALPPVCSPMCAQMVVALELQLSKTPAGQPRRRLFRRGAV
jgi:hypothetical protein